MPGFLFTAGEFKIIGPGRHAYDSSKPQACWLSRSLDGGLTWKIEKPDALRGHKDPKAAPIGPATGGIRSDNPDCMILCAYAGVSGAEAIYKLRQAL